MKIKIVSWNIAGGHKIASLNHFDYKPEDILYFADRLKDLSPDVICLQESHTYKEGNKSNAADIAIILGMKVIVNTKNSSSHIDPNLLLGNSIISKFNVNSKIEEYYPDPEGQLYWSDGRIADTHKKSLQIVSLEGFNIANTQLLPVRLFGFSYDDNNRGKNLVYSINDVMRKIVTRPIILCGDFNYDEPLKLYQYLNKIELTDSLPDVTTRPSKDGVKRKPDHIFYSPEFKLLNGDVIITNTDHYLCFAEFNF